LDLTGTAPPPARSSRADHIATTCLTSADYSNNTADCLDEEMSEHLGYEKADRAAARTGNHRNGGSPKTVRTEVGPVELVIPRDRNGSFAPKIVP
jgi:transposase-like protein